jgi:hypothetical protein
MTSNTQRWAHNGLAVALILIALAARTRSPGGKNAA